MHAPDEVKDTGTFYFLKLRNIVYDTDKLWHTSKVMVSYLTWATHSMDSKRAVFHYNNRFLLTAHELGFVTHDL